MTLFLAKRTPGDIGPLPVPGTEVWLEDLQVGPVGTIVGEVRGNRLRVDAPRLGGAEVEVTVGRVLAITYAAGDVPCEARTEVVVAEPEDVPGIWLRVDAVERMQRRSAVRVPVQLIARLIAEDAPEDAEAPEVLESGITEDLSAGGVLMRLMEPVPLGSRVRLVIHCGGSGGDVEVPAIVVRVERDERSARPFRAALTFPDIDRAAESRLVRFLFDRQRQLRRREIGLD